MQQHLEQTLQSLSGESNLNDLPSIAGHTPRYGYNSGATHDHTKAELITAKSKFYALTVLMEDYLGLVSVTDTMSLSDHTTNSWGNKLAADA